MTPLTHPPKQLIRQYLQRRRCDPNPPPTPQEIRRQLGWELLAPEAKPGNGPT